MDLARYRGHLALPEVGEAGQHTLARARVLCIGTGGLGSPASLYLAAAGVGTLGLVDSDVVDTSNLHRQILFRTADVGAPKLATAAAALRALNPEITIVEHEGRLTADNVDALLAGYDVIVDGTDNFPTRYLVNDACVRLGKADVWASIYRFEGQVAVFDASRGPCYRCLFPEIPPDEEIPACAEAGVLGVLPGIMGTAQALEAIKLCLGIGEPLIGRVMVFDGLRYAWTTLELEKDPNCPGCGSGTLTPRAEPPKSLTARELAAYLASEPHLQVVDVRDPDEWEVGHLAGSQLVPLGDLAARMAEIDRKRPIIVLCFRGPRSLKAATQLTLAGYEGVKWLDGGLTAWSRDVDPAMKL